jgi:hypothetical protein
MNRAKPVDDDGEIRVRCYELGRQAGAWDVTLRFCHGILAEGGRLISPYFWLLMIV